MSAAVVGSAGTELTLSWPAAIDNSGTGVTYNVFIGNNGSGSESSTPINANPIAALNYLVTGLTANDPYVFVIEAVDGNGTVSDNPNELTVTPTPP
jgi:hypothetical protein